MKLVSLQLPTSENSSVSFTVEGNFSSDELNTLEQFVKLMGRIRTCALLSRGMGGFGGLTLDNTGLTIRSAPCTDGELYELLHVMRPVTQYHTDDNKAEAWSRLEASLGEPNAKAVVLSQLHGKVMALMNVDYVAQQVMGAPDSDA